MSARRTSTGSHQQHRQTRSERRSGYFYLSMRPLHVLVFLLPLVLLYEVGSAVYLVSDDGRTRQNIEANKLLADFFNLFGLPGLFLPAIALLTVFFVWHVMSGDRWRIRPGVLGLMVAESAAWTIPLLLIGVLHVHSAAAATWHAALASGGAPLAEMSWQARLTISIGAGLYEEMLFRLILIAALHALFADLLGVRHGAAATIAVIGSALAFALYHDTALPTGGTDWARLTFFLIAGLYLGAVYAVRGFGIVVGAHALYDVFVLVFLPHN